MSRYMVTIPLSAAPCPDEQSPSTGLPPRPVSRAMIAKVGVAARHSHLARPRVAVAPSSSRVAGPLERAGCASVMHGLSVALLEDGLTGVRHLDPVRVRRGLGG